MMTRKEMAIQELGLAGYRKLSPSFRALLDRMDMLPPVGKRGSLKKKRRRPA